MDGIDGVKNFVFRLGVGMVQGQDGFVEQDGDARPSPRNVIERIVNHIAVAAR